MGKLSSEDISFSSSCSFFYTVKLHSLTQSILGPYWEDLDLDGWIILGWICRRWDVGIWTGLGWPRIETVGGSL